VKNPAPSPSLHADALHTIGNEEAVALVERLLGPASEWPSPLLAYRMASSFQRDWVAELGHWLDTAGQLGYQESLVRRLLARAKRPSRSDGVDPNDQRGVDLAAELAPAMVVHYLAGTGWRFIAWEPPAKQGDVDLRLLSPNGTAVDVQVESPDVPGRISNHRLVGGEFDNRVTAAVGKAAQQLQGASHTSMIVICANRSWSLATDPQCVVAHAVGSTVEEDGAVALPMNCRGKFYSGEWSHVGGIVMIDCVRGSRDLRYCCTVLVNLRRPSRSRPTVLPTAGSASSKMGDFAGFEANQEMATHCQTARLISAAALGVLRKPACR
jgi:hypothetical protein